MSSISLHVEMVEGKASLGNLIAAGDFTEASNQMTT